MPRRVLSGIPLLVLVCVGVLFLPGAPYFPVAQATPQDPPRLALVIGNGSYAEGSLPTAKADAGLVSETLAQLGFDVTALADGQSRVIRRAVHLFAEKVRAAGDRSIVIVYIAGYGVQYAGANFLVPVDAAIDRQADVPAQALPLTDITQELEALPVHERLFVFDLERAVPFAKADPLPLADGLMLALAPRGATYAFNAAPGSSAPSDPPLYGLYARTLVAMLRTPGLTIAALLQKVRLRVAQATGGAIVPWYDSNGSGETVLLPADHGPVVGTVDQPIEDLPADSAFWTAIARDRLSIYETFVRTFPADDLTVRIKALLAVRLEAATWSESVRVDLPAAYWTYMRRYPRGPHYIDVRRRLAALRASLEPPMRFEPYQFPGLSVPDPDQVRAVAPPAAEAADPASEVDRFVAPPMPDNLMSRRASALDLALAPPLLVPEAALPIPPPLPSIAVAAWPAMPGSIEQPFVPGLGRVMLVQRRTEQGEAVLELSTAAGLVTRTVVSGDKKERTVVQSDAAEDVLSRTIETTPDNMTVAMSQTGPDGGLMMRIDAGIDALGERHRRIVDGSGSLVAEVAANRWDVITSVRRGPGRLAAPTFHLPPLDFDETDRSADPQPEQVAPAGAPKPDPDLRQTAAPSQSEP